MRAKVLLADDHPVVAEGLASLIREDFDLVGIVSDGLALVDAALQFRPDVIVTDLQMPRMSGLDALRRLRAEGLDTRFLFLSGHSEAELATGVIRAGAAGFMLKTEAGDRLHTAITEVLNGRVYVSATLVRP
jgi:DNA-binding NarL/FixJ family response regulator